MAKHARLGVLVLPAAWAIGAAEPAAQPSGLDLMAYYAPAVPDLVTDGTAIVALTIRASGRVDDVVTLSATERRLGEAAREAVRQWRFARDPDVGRGPDAERDLVLRREVVEFDFRRQGIVTSLSHVEGAKSWFPADFEPEVRTLLRDELVAPPLQVSAAPSAAALARIAELTVAGRASVSFVIDEAGAVRVPVVAAADHPSLGEAALALVAEWRYEPPMHDGKPVLVEERKTFTFAPDADENWHGD